MIMNMTHHDLTVGTAGSLRQSGEATCKQLVSQIQKMRSALLGEFRLRAHHQERLLQLALNEAEALSHETGFPLLTFPALAREKVETVAAWTRHQTMVRLRSPMRMAA